MSDYADAVVAAALPFLDDEQDPPRESKPATATADDGFKPWQPPSRDPWTDKANLRLASDPRGIVAAEEMRKEGHIAAEDLEVVRELWGTPKDHFYKIEDPTSALDVAAFYRERGLVDDDEFRGLCEGLAHREVERERQEATRLDEQTRQEQERIDREQQAENQRAEIQQRATDLFYDKLDRLNAAQTEAR